MLLRRRDRILDGLLEATYHATRVAARLIRAASGLEPLLGDPKRDVQSVMCAIDAGISELQQGTGGI